MPNVACPFLFTTLLVQCMYSKWNAYARSKCMEIIWTSSKCGNSKTPYNVVVGHSKHWIQISNNIFDARIGGFGKNTQGRMSKETSLCVQTNHWKEKLFNMLDVTHKSSKANIMGKWVSQAEAKTTYLQTNQMKEQVVLMFVATTRRDSWKLSWQYMLLMELWLHTKHRKEKMFNIFVATHKASLSKSEETWMSQGEIIPSTCLQANHRIEQCF